MRPTPCDFIMANILEVRIEIVIGSPWQKLNQIIDNNILSSKFNVYKKVWKKALKNAENIDFISKL